MKWERIALRAREHAHKVRQALASALELHSSGKWGKPEIEAAGLRDYARIFGHSINARTFWRIFDRTLERDGGAGDFRNLELYLPFIVTARKAPPAFERAAADLPELAAAVLRVENPNALTPAESQLVWLGACSECKRVQEAGAPAHKARKLVLRALAASGLELAHTPRALRVTFARKLERWIEGGYAPDAVRDQRAEQSGNYRALPISDDDRKTLTARALSGGLAKAWRETHAVGKLSAEAVQTYIANPASKSYVPQRVRDLVTHDVRILYDIHHGPRQAALKGAYITRDWSGVAPGDWYSADDTTLPLYYWEEDADGSPRVLRGQCLVMNDCRTNRILALALHSERNYTAKVIRGLIMRTHDTYGLPRAGFFFERGTWASAKILKGAADEVPSDETEIGLRAWVEFKHAKPGNARAKTVERIIGLLQVKMEDQPGYCGRNEQVEKFERLQRQLLDVKSVKVHPKEFLLHRDEWMKRLHEICDAYNHETQQGQMLRGLSPCEAWDTLFDASRPLTRLTAETRYLLANHRRPLKVTRNGICVQFGKERHHFRNEITGRLIGRTVQVYFNPDDMSSIFIKLATGDKTAAVIPAEPVTPAMTATREEMQAAQASVAAHNRPARTLYQEIKPYFPKNGPAPFRRVVADEASVELGRDIAADQAAVRATQAGSGNTDRKLANLRRRFGKTDTQDTVSREAQLEGYKLLEDANTDAH